MEFGAGGFTELTLSKYLLSRGTSGDHGKVVIECQPRGQDLMANVVCAVNGITEPSLTATITSVDYLTGTITE